MQQNLNNREQYLHAVHTFKPSNKGQYWEHKGRCLMFKLEELTNNCLFNLDGTPMHTNDRHDVIFTLSGQTFLGDIKIRLCGYTDIQFHFHTDGEPAAWGVDSSKWHYLKEHAQHLSKKFNTSILPAVIHYYTKSKLAIIYKLGGKSEVQQIPNCPTNIERAATKQAKFIEFTPEDILFKYQF